MPTLFEIIMEKFKDKEPVEFQFHNPLKLKIGHILNINLPELQDLAFTLDSVMEVKRIVNGESHPFVDYNISANPYNKDLVHRKLRLIPNENKTFPQTVIELQLLDEFPYDEGFHKGLAYENNQGEFLEGDNKYWRVNDMQSEWNANTATISDLDRDGTAEEDEIQKGKLTYWDFWRKTEDEAKNQILEFYFVQMDENGFFQIWIGNEISPKRVKVN